MNSTSDNMPYDDLPERLMIAVNSVCNRFEQLWRTGNQPSVMEMLDGSDSSYNAVLIRELIPLDIEYRQHAGLEVTVAHYAMQFPQLDEIWLANILCDSAKEIAEKKSSAQAERHQTRVPTRLGRYDILDRIGSGGFGIVYRAFDDELKRDVAIKVPHMENLSTSGATEAFLEEARTIAGLDHPAIVPVFDVGRTDDGICYVVTKYIDGSELTATIESRTLSFTQIAAVLADVANALHSAHLNGITHRDIKPANILLDTNGNAYVADFGLALRDADTESRIRVAGTPSYMSPEQARGESHRVDGRTDIFSLGIVMYELLSGCKPFRADSAHAVLDLIKHFEPRPPRQLNDRIPRELERICLKMLSKRVVDRYSTAADLADELQRYRDERTKRFPSDTIDHVSFSTEAKTDDRVEASSKADEPNILPKGLRSFDSNDAAFFLRLLPGPRGADGLPECIRFWKHRIECTDFENPFAIGMLYGPSGSGKSSLIKAGLVPNLRQTIGSVYVESTPSDTETRLLSAIHQRYPQLNADFDLPACLSALRVDELDSGSKLLIVIDQFEQWLLAHPSPRTEPLVDALRQCDGSNVQCLLIVRDDFWLSSCRFMDALEIELVPDRNVAVVDLFDKIHARKVLTQFGRAHDRLPARDAEMTEHQSKFVADAIDGLAREDRVVPIRLALFADLAKGAAWEPETLPAFGGMRGLGVYFLDESFNSRSSLPKHRLHRDAAQAVLQMLLPDHGADIKGAMRSRDELFQASTYDNLEDFDQLLRILDSELRLITPTDPPNSDNEHGSHFQLTHDYLVPSLRDWLTRQKRETARGRAELRMQERSAIWNEKPELGRLPGLREWLTFRFFVGKNEWSPANQRMMKAAFHRHASRIGLLAAIILTVSIIGHRWHYRRESTTLVNRLLEAKTDDVPRIISELESYRRRVDPILKQTLVDAKQGENSRDRYRALHASLALLPTDDSQIDYLTKRLTQTSLPQVLLIRDALPHDQSRVIEPLWNQLREDRASTGGVRLRAAIALAKLDPPGPDSDNRWDEVSRTIVSDAINELLKNPGQYALLRDSLFPAKLPLIPAFKVTSEQKVDTGRSRLAMSLLADFGENNAELLAELALDCTGIEFQVLVPKLEAQRREVSASFIAALNKGPSQSDQTEEQIDAVAQRKANAAIALFLLGDGDHVWKLLQDDHPDPRVRTFLIERFSAFGLDPRALARRLAEEKNTKARTALILAIGNYVEQGYSPEEIGIHVDPLMREFREHPDAGLHSAIDWLARKCDWTDSLRQVEQDARGLAIREDFDWHVNTEGHTLAVIRKPQFFMMGSPPNDPERFAINESPLPMKIIYDFAIGTKEVTIEQYHRFVEDNNEHRSRKKYSGLVTDLSESPVIFIDWYKAVAYCNWLSKKEGLQPCYVPNEKGQYWDGTRILEDFRKRNGYRLPLKVEWEYACRALTTTSRYYGYDPSLLPRYAWYRDNANDFVWPVGQQKPNGFGLFDMLGNVSEWCTDQFDRKKTRGPIIIDGDFRSVCGGDIDRSARACRSAHVNNRTAATSGSTTGFRIARRLRSSPEGQRR